MSGGLSGRAKLIVTGLLALSMCGGCSYIFVQPPKDDDLHARGVLTCTTTPIAPVVDSVFTLTNLLSVFYVANENNVTDKGTPMAAGLAVAAIWLSSAIYGYYNTSQCADLAREDDPGPYHRPVHYQHAVFRPPPAPPPVVPAPAGEPEAAPSHPSVQQQEDDDDAPRPRQQPDDNDPAMGSGRRHPSASPRLDLTPRFGN
jgi:hypothetical protein